jgi:hypothetical protein
METLCQHCLAVVDVDKDVFFLTSGENLCDCGGDVCNCRGCLAKIADLRQGVRDPVVLGCSSNTVFPLEGWNEKTGIRTELAAA